MNSNDTKAVALGEPYGTANNKLRKSLLFDFAKRLDEDICYRCGVKIDSIEEFSIEHKVSWLNSEDPIRYFYSLDNIAFSHIKCNLKDSGFKSKGRVSKYRRIVKSGNSWCYVCKMEKPLTEFTLNRHRWRGVEYECRECRKIVRK